MTFMITAIFLAASAFVTCTQSAYLVNCPTNFIFNTQYHMCVQQSHCGLLNQNCAINYAPFQYEYLSGPTYYNMFYNYHSVCQPTICPCYYSTCQHIQYCYHQIPCFYWNVQNSTTTTRPQPAVTTTTLPTTTTTTTTTETPFDNLISTTEREIEPTTKSTTTPKVPDFTEFDRPEVELQMSNIIQTHNNVHNPVHVNNTNIVKVGMNWTRIEHTTKSKPKSQTTVTTKVPTKRPIRPKIKCCTVYSPKLCKCRYDGSWYCYHSNYRRCGHFCYRDSIYLRPRHIEYHPPILVIPPPQWHIEQNEMDYDYGLTMDCSGCIYGEYHCSLACYSYSCNTNRCGYIDQERFCEHYGGHGCSEHDGYFSVDYY